jgi:Type IV secretion-system coupling protein DNA-binding domain
VTSLLHGWSGLLIGYANVAAPMMATLIRRRATTRILAIGAALGVPLTVVAAIGNFMVTPVLRGLGVAGGGFLELAAGVGLAAAVGYGAGRRLVRAAAPTSVHQRGTVVHGAELGFSGADIPAGSPAAEPLSGARAASHSNSRPREAAVTLAGLPVAPLDETKHFKLIGTTGTGKSTAIRELLGAALARGDRAIIADPDGGYLARFASKERRSVILNPFDPDSLKWDLFGEIESTYDVDQLARSLLPDHGSGSDRTWTGYARTFFTAVTRQAHEAGVKDISELYRLLVVADATELRNFVAGTPAQPFLEEHNGRMFDSIRSVTSSAVASLDYVAQQNAPPLSVRQWVRDGSTGGALFIPYRATQIAALRSTISAWMRLAIFEAMSQPEGDQRLWFVVDELDALGAIDGLKDALARLRKFGGRCVLGFQSIAQVSSTYGQGEAQTIVENCGNTLILRCSGSDHGGTANFASRLIGQREVLRTSTSRSRRPTDFLSSTTVSEHVAIEPAVMDSEIEQLPDLSGYLKFASVPSWQRVTLGPGESAQEQARSAARSLWSEWRANRATGESCRSPSSPERVRDHATAPRRHDVDYER